MPYLQEEVRVYPHERDDTYTTTQLCIMRALGFLFMWGIFTFAPAVIGNCWTIDYVWYALMVSIVLVITYVFCYSVIKQSRARPVPVIVLGAIAIMFCWCTLGVVIYYTAVRCS